MPELSSRSSSIPLSGIRQMAQLAAAIPNVLRLEIGDPDFHTPAHITEAAYEWASRNRVGYPPNAGISDLRSAIAGKLTEKNSIACEAANVNVTVGATGALSLALQCVVNEGDGVLVPDPGWAGYPAMVALAGAVVEPYSLPSSEGFQLSVDAVRCAVTPRSKAIIINGPGNPTGVMFSRQAIVELLEFARERDMWVIADECYDEMVFEGDHFAVSALEPIEDSRVLSAFSFSKTYAMTGWRIGYLAASSVISAHVTRMQAASVASASAVSQMAALAALSSNQDCVSEMVASYRQRRDIAALMLDQADVPYVPPAGALYIFVDISASGQSSRDFSLELLKDHKVCVTPGSAFGGGGEGYVRVSLACAEVDLRQGLERLTGLLRQKRQ